MWLMIYIMYTGTLIHAKTLIQHINSCMLWTNGHCTAFGCQNFYNSFLYLTFLRMLNIAKDQ